MTRLEPLLKSARRRDVSVSAASAARDFPNIAIDNGLLDVGYTMIELPFGSATVAATKRGLVRIAYDNLGGPETVLEDLAARISPRILEAPSLFDGLRRELDEYFEGERTSFDLPIDWRLTDGFARKVLRSTARIPYGETSTYGKVAAKAGNPKAARAAGNALGSNPIPIVVPCHRVLHAGGGLGGYTGGLDYKRRLLETEGALR